MKFKITICRKGQSEPKVMIGSLTQVKMLIRNGATNKNFIKEQGIWPSSHWSYLNALNKELVMNIFIEAV